MLTIYNTLIRQKEEFKPITKGKIKLYVCGITVYDYCHVGHARVFVVFDAIVRFLRETGWDVTYVRNITDIDDKIINRANENKEDINALTDRFIEYMYEDAKSLGVFKADLEPRATQHMPQIIKMIADLEKNGIAYVAENKDVYFSVENFETYGILSHKDIDNLKAGIRVEVVEAKRNPLDFVLWKKSKQNEPQWDSPWGPGRPGWHIECSAMSTHCLGNTFDIHGGGSDLVFPHHENERAQAIAANKGEFVNTWMHVGFVQIDKEKMSKSLGNFFTIREVLEEYDGEVIRYFLLASHYRSPVNYSKDQLTKAKNALTTLYTALRGVNIINVENQQFIENEYVKQFRAAMNDDFNTPIALSVLFELAHKVNQLRLDNQDSKVYAGILKKLANTLGFFRKRA